MVFTPDLARQKLQTASRMQKTKEDKMREVRHVIVCPKCERVKKLQEWIEIREALEDIRVTMRNNPNIFIKVIHFNCPRCKYGDTNL